MQTTLPTTTGAHDAALFDPLDSTPVKIRAFSLALDCVQIQIDLQPVTWRLRRQMLQRRALLRLAGCPRLNEHGRRR
jgi:hypothetical protein